MKIRLDQKHGHTNDFIYKSLNLAFIAYIYLLLYIMCQKKQHSKHQSLLLSQSLGSKFGNGMDSDHFLDNPMNPLYLFLNSPIRTVLRNLILQLQKENSLDLEDHLNLFISSPFSKIHMLILANVRAQKGPEAAAPRLSSEESFSLTCGAVTKDTCPLCAAARWQSLHQPGSPATTWS